ncbi:MAG: prohibitin family protein [archaeon]
MKYYLKKDDEYYDKDDDFTYIKKDAKIFNNYYFVNTLKIIGKISGKNMSIEEIYEEEDKMNKTRKENKSMMKPASMIILGILAIILLLNSFFIVNAGERGVLLTLGKPSMQAYGEGVHFKIPLVQKAVNMEVKTIKFETPADSASKDLQVVSTSLAINYKIIPDEAPKIYQTMGLDYRQRVIEPAIQESIKAVTAGYTAEELITKRPLVRADIHEDLESRVQQRGIIIEDVMITNFDFSESFNEAIELKVTAEQRKLQAERDLQRIEVEARQIEAAAIGEKNARIAEAQGEAESMRIIEEQLRNSPQYLEWYKTSRWDGVLPLATGGATPFISIN